MKEKERYAFQGGEGTRDNSGYDLWKSWVSCIFPMGFDRYVCKGRPYLGYLILERPFDQKRFLSLKKKENQVEGKKTIDQLSFNNVSDMLSQK